VPTEVVVTVQGSTPVTSSGRMEAATRHELPVLGLYPGVVNTLIFEVRHSSTTVETDTIKVQAPVLPDYFPAIRIDRNAPSLKEPGFTLIEFIVGGEGLYNSQPLLFDGEGVVRWYLNLEWIGAPLRRLRNGNLLLGAVDQLVELDMLGRVLRLWPLPGYQQHHDVIEKPDGNFIVPVTNKDTESGLDRLIEVDRSSGEILRRWDLREMLDVDRYDLIRFPWDWLHVNSIDFDEEKQTVLLSARHQGIFEFSYSGALHWILAPHQGWGEAGAAGQGFDTGDFLLSAVSAAGVPYGAAQQAGIEGMPGFRWPWGQHAAVALPNGNILTFDNGWNRHFQNDVADFSRAVEYQVDEQRREVRQVWQFGESRGAGFYSFNVSDVDWLPKTGNRLLISGNIRSTSPKQAKVVEIRLPENEVVFEATVLFKNKFAVDNTNDLLYRGERMSIYPGQ
jgi:arylsulfate sulfotransferase